MIRSGLNYIYGLFFIALLFSCEKKTIQPTQTDTNKPIELSKVQKLYPKFDLELLRKEVLMQLQQDSILYDFYEENDFKLIWGLDSLYTNNFIFFDAILKNIERHGLPADYFGEINIKEQAEAISEGIAEDSVYRKMAQLDLKTTDIALKFVEGMNFGFLQPDSLFGKLYDIKIRRADSAFRSETYSAFRNDVSAAIFCSLPLDDSIYTAMQEAYVFWENLSKEDKPKIIQPKGYNLAYKAGEKHKNITAIADRLMWSNQYAPDSLDTDTLNQTLSKSLLKAINSFRKQISYPEDEEIAALTINALNRDANYYIDRLAANMERYRWKRAKQREPKHIEVNIPAFKLFATETDSVPVIMRVCVGAVKHKTPILESNLAYINLNPTWNVPISIARNEIFPAMRRDPSYMSTRNMKLYRGGKEVDFSDFDWKKDKISPNVYFVRQGPGSNNSLGRLKFMFANNFSVYLHDTPAKMTFMRKNRAVSHGCIRLQQPLELAFFCTRPSEEIDRDEIRYAVDQRVKTKEAKKWNSENHKAINDIIRMKTKTSLAVDYYTVYMQPGESTLYYADDVYSYDTIILEALGRIKSTKNKTTQEKTETDGVF